MTNKKSELLTHFDSSGQAHMVDVGTKSDTHRIAVATGKIKMLPATLALIIRGNSKKGDVLGIARIAAIQASKKTSDLIPLCHPIALTRVGVEFEILENESSVCCRVSAETFGKTGVEMEALNAVSVGLLTIYDMCKSSDKSMIIKDIMLLQKSGGRSGDWQRNDKNT